MKLCALCGTAAADNAPHCQACGEATFVVRLLESHGVAVVASEEPALVAEPIEPAPRYSLERRGKGKR